MPDDPAPGDGAPSPAPRTYSPQDRELQDEITAWTRSLTAARDDAEVQAILAPVGFGPDKLDALLALAADAQTGYNRRAQAMGTAEDADDAKAAAVETAREEYALFRKLARARFRDDEAALDALNLNGDVPRALNQFVTHARAAYANGAVAPYAAGLDERGYPERRLIDLAAGLNALVTAAGNVDRADEAAKTATATRDAAADTARQAFAEYRDTARPLLGPLAARLGL